MAMSELDEAEDDGGGVSPLVGIFFVAAASDNDASTLDATSSSSCLALSDSGSSSLLSFVGTFVDVFVVDAVVIVVSFSLVAAGDNVDDLSLVLAEDWSLARCICFTKC